MLRPTSVRNLHFQCIDSRLSGSKIGNQIGTVLLKLMHITDVSHASTVNSPASRGAQFKDARDVHPCTTCTPRPGAVALSLDPVTANTRLNGTFWWMYKHWSSGAITSRVFVLYFRSFRNILVGSCFRTSSLFGWWFRGGVVGRVCRRAGRSRWFPIAFFPRQTRAVSRRRYRDIVVSSVCIAFQVTCAIPFTTVHPLRR